MARGNAAADGTVSEIGWDPDGYGHYVMLYLGGGLRSLYAHLALALGMLLRHAGLLGYVGSTGASSGPHLHFELRRDDLPVDPIQVIPSR